ncbi:MAG TPA: hypothetical protein VGQ08_17795 [Nitrospiraceae bacterium]|nr:hypothetical protein [Nitrospiraceae bacterium]
MSNTVQGLPCGLLGLMLVVTLVGCTHRPLWVDGLKPDYPPAQVEMVPGFMTAWAVPAFPQVDSLTPTFRWAALANPGDRASDADKLLPNPSEITYELRIWRVEDGYQTAWHQGKKTGDPGRLYYSRESLREPLHKMDQPLEPATKYFWSVRAVVLLHGYPKVTEWAEQTLSIWWPYPNRVSYFGFETPAVAAAQ